MKCPPGSHFNALLEICDSEVACSACNGFVQPSAPFACPRPDGAFPCEEDCNAYWSCLNYVAFHMKCPAGMHYDAASETCSDQVECQSCIANVTTPAPPTAYFTCPKPDGAFPNRENYREYWRCTDSLALLMKCPPSLKFDPALEKCL